MAENTLGIQLEELNFGNIGDVLPSSMVPPDTVDVDLSKPSDDSLRAKARKDADILGTDPNQVLAEMQAGNGEHSRSAEVQQLAINRQGQQLYQRVEALKNKKEITKADYEELKRLYKGAKGIDQEDAATIGRVLSQLDSEFNRSKPRTANGSKVDKNRKQAAESFALMRSRVLYEEAGKVLGTETTPAKGAQVTGELGMMFAPGFGTVDSLSFVPAMASAYEELTGKTLTRAQQMRVGDVLDGIRTLVDEAEKLPPEQREAEVRRIYSTVFRANEEAGISRNVLRGVWDIVPTLEEGQQTYNLGGFTVTTNDINNTAYMLEAVLGLVGLRAGTKQTTKFVKGKLAKFAEDNRIANAGIEDLGTIKGRVAQLRPKQNPNAIGPNIKQLTVPEVAPNPFKMVDLKGNSGAGIEDFLKETELKVESAGLQVNSKLFEEVEQDALITAAQQKIRDAGGTVRPEYTEVIARDNAGFRMAALVGNSGEAGWSSPIDALYFAADNLPMDSTVLVRRDLVTGEFEDISGDALKNTSELIGKPGEYFLKVDHHYKYNPEDRALFGVTAPVQVTIGGEMARMLLEPASRFSKQMLDFARGAVNKEAAVKDAANNILRGNFLKLHGNSRAAVMQVLEDGDKLGKEFNYDELVTKYPNLTQKEQKAYFEARAFNRYLYDTANRSMRDRMEREGWKGMYKLGSGEAPEFVRKVDNIDEVPEYLWDLRNNTVITKADAIASGLDIVKYNSPKVMGVGGKYTHAIVSNDYLYDSLPARVLNFNAGQVTRVYDENWFVRVKTQETVNGRLVDTDKVVATARTWKEAQAHVAKLQEDAPAGTTYTAGRDEKALRALAEGTYDFDVQGALLTSSRGSRLTRVDGSPARILDPFNAMNVARDVVASREAWTDYMASMKTLGARTWPEHFVVDPDTGSVVLKGSRTEGGFEEAEHFYNWIESMESGNLDAIMFKQRMVQLSQRLQEKGTAPEWIADPIARALNNVPDVDPLRTARSLAFLHHIALAGPRTLLLNSLQPLFLMGISPIHSLRALAVDQWVLHFAMLNRDNPNLDRVLAGVLKTAGLGSGDASFYRAAMEAYRLSGLPYSLDSHAFFRGTTFSPALKSTDSLMSEVVKGMVSAIPKAGSAVFRGGEQVNLASTFMVAARRYKDKHPKADWNDPRVWSEIGSDARALSLDMSKVNDLSYQKGWLSIPFQYFAISHKALTFMFTNKSVKDIPHLRKRMLVGSMAIYGAAGLPLGPEFVDDALSEAGVDLSTLPQDEAVALRNAIHGGLIDLTWNELMADDGGSVKVAKSLSMVNGVIDLFKSYLSEDTPVYAAATGAAGSLYSTYDRVMDELKVIYSRGDWENPDNAMKALAIMPEVTSGWSRYAKAQLGMQMQATVNKNFKPMVNQTMSENWAKGVFGFESYREAETFALMRTQEEVKAETQKDVDALTRNLVRTFLNYGTDYTAAHAEIANMQAVYVQSDYTYWVWQQAMEGVLTAQATVIGGGLSEDRHEKIVTEIIKGMTKGSVEADLVGRITNTDEFIKLPKEEQDKLRTVLQYSQEQFFKDTAGNVEED